MKQRKCSGYVFFPITSIISILIGLICLSHPNKTSELVVIIIGIALITYGIIELFSFFTYRLRGLLVLSILVILAGITCFIRPEFILSIMGVLLGFFLTLQGCLTIKNTFVLKKAGFQLWWIWLIPSGIIVLIGTSWIFNPSRIYGIFAVILGLGFLINGLSILSLFFFNKKHP